MDNLMKLLGDDKSKPKTSMPDEDADLSGEELDAQKDGDEGFAAAASECMDALSSGDVDAFSQALKTCIEMG